MLYTILSALLFTRLLLAQGVPQYQIPTPGIPVAVGTINPAAVCDVAVYSAGTTVAGSLNFCYDDAGKLLTLGTNAFTFSYNPLGDVASTVFSINRTGGEIAFSDTAASPGANGADMKVSSVNGQNTTIATTGVGGNAGDIQFTGGRGGDANSAVVSDTGGDGGYFVASAGAGGGAQAVGAGANVGGAGADAELDSGDGGPAANGMTNTGGNAGNITMLLGSGGTGSTANGSDGIFEITAGARANSDIQQWQLNNGTVVARIQSNGMYQNRSVVFANLGTPANGTQVYCSDCGNTTNLVGANTCANMGTGAMAYRINGAWKCYQ